ncbi:MAG: hypothetical protein ACK4GJ_02725 [bacterium]
MNLYICPRASNCISKIVKHFENHFKKIEIYLPVNICYTVPLSLMYTKGELKFYDIDYYTLYPDLDSVNKIFEKEFLENKIYNESELLIFLCVIPYGNWNTVKLKEYKSKILETLKLKSKLKSSVKDSVFIIWDCALVFPVYEVLQYINENCSSYESFVFSFSYAKPLELGFGSALFTKQNITYNFPLTVDKNLISFLVNKVDKKFKTYLNLEKVKSKNQSFTCYNSELHINDQKYILKILEKIYIKEDFSLILRKNIKSSYFEILNKKLKTNLLFREFFKLKNKQGIETLDDNPLSWRFNIRVDSKIRNSLIDEIFKEDVFVSRLFPSLAKYLNLNQNFPNSSQHWQKIINIFNNQEETYNQKILKIFDKFFKN